MPHIKPWQDRFNEFSDEMRAKGVLYTNQQQADSAASKCKSDEIAELRAALAGYDPEHGSAYMYKLPGDYDWHVDFAPLPEGAFRIKALAAGPLPQQAAGDEQLQLQYTQVAYAIFTESGNVQIWFTKIEGAESWLHNNKDDPRKPEPIYRAAPVELYL